MMRDKLINHAIRQAYDELLPVGRFAAYVLYIELDPRQVDVNVHPAKHEVRFHQARLIHDFIFQALFTALRQQERPATSPWPRPWSSYRSVPHRVSGSGSQSRVVWRRAQLPGPGSGSAGRQ